MKFDFRVGICLAALTISAACSKSPEAPTAPVCATKGAPSAAAADGSTLKFNAPALVTPVDRSRAEDRRPTLVWANAQSKYAGIGVAYDIEVSYADRHRVHTDGWRIAGLRLAPPAVRSRIRHGVFVARSRPRRRRCRTVGELGGVPVDGAARRHDPRRSTAGGPAACAAPLSPMGPGETRKATAERLGDRPRCGERFPGCIAQFLPGARRYVGIHGPDH